MDQATQALQSLRRHLSAHKSIRPLPFAESEQTSAQHIAQMLRRSRTSRGWSQQFAAQKLCVSRAQYVRYEAGSAVPRLHTACLWSLRYGVPPSVLLTHSAYPSGSPELPRHFFRLSQWLCDAPVEVFAQTLDHVQQLLGTSAHPIDPHAIALPPQTLAAARAEVSGHDLYPIIGANLRLTRQILGYSQEAIANGLGISTSHYLRIERGETSYSFLLLPRFSLSMQLPSLVLAVNTRYHAGREALNVRLEAVLQVLQPLPEPVCGLAIDYITQAMTLHSAHRGA
ncbi:MAG: helix-turn-helix transcriptional regulator [Natronospirillum sp.]